MFHITSEKYDGIVELLYDDNGLLQKLNFGNSSLRFDGVMKMKNIIPSQVAQLAEVFKDTTVTIVEAAYEITFEMWWTKYDKKINRKRCEQLWNKLSKPDQVKAYFGIDAYNKYLKREGWRTKADPETYLRNEYWCNEYK